MRRNSPNSAFSESPDAEILLSPYRGEGCGGFVRSNPCHLPLAWLLSLANEGMHGAGSKPVDHAKGHAR